MNYFLKKNYIIFLLIFITIKLSANNRIILHSDYIKVKEIKDIRIVNLVKKEGLEYFDKLNFILLKCIDDDDLKCIRSSISKGAHTRTGIYYASLKNKTEILNRLFKYDKIDFNNEIYFLPHVFYDDNYKKIEKIKVFKGKEFLIYKNTYSKLDTILENINLINLKTLKLILKNSFNKNYLSRDTLFHIIRKVNSYDKIKILIKVFNLNWFDKNSNDDTLINIIVKNANFSVLRLIFELDIKKSMINFKSNFYDFNILEVLSFKRGKYKKKINFLQSKGAKKSLSKIDYELYHAILFDKTNKIKKNSMEGADIGKVLKLYLMIGRSCKLRKNGKCVFYDKNCKYLDFFLKNNKDFSRILPYSSCKNNDKYKVFDKISDDDIKLYGNEAIIESIVNNDIINLEYLLKRGIDVNFFNRCCDNVFYTILDLAFKLKNNKMIKLLKKNNAKRVCEILGTNCEKNKINSFYTFIK